MKRLTISVVVAAAVFVAGPVAAEGEAGVTPIGGLSFAEQIELTVVNVIAHVTDDKGRAITDLKAEDFRITQDGETKQISNFELYTDELFRHSREAVNLPGPTPTPMPSAEEFEARPVYLIIYVDNDNLRAMDRNRVLRQVRPFIRDHLFEPVQMMVVTYQKSLEVVVPFTSDQTEVLNGLRGIMRQTANRESMDSERRRLQENMQRLRQEYEETQARQYYSLLSQIEGFAEEEANNLAFTIGALREIVTTTSGLPGKKSVLYISNGLPMIAGLDLYYAFASTFNEPSIISQTATFDQSAKFQSLVATANAQDVSFYTVGAAGLSMTGIASAEYATPQDSVSMSMGDSNLKDSLRFIARRTGGAAIVNSNDVTAGLTRVSQDFFTYYSLGYPLQTSGADKVHDIEVSLPDHPDYTLRYRRRFVEKSIETKVQDKVITGLFFPIDDNPMDVDCTTGPAAPASGDRWVVPFEVTFPLRRIALLPEGEDYVGRITLFLAARDRGGEQSDTIRQEHEVRIPAALYEKSQRERFTIKAPLLMKPGSYKISLALLDPITRQSSYRLVTTRIDPE